MLEIELVPKTSWFENLRSILPKKQWDFLRKKTYRDCDYRCSICGGVGSKWPVECHEVWNYDDKSKTQTLIGLEGFCPSCHEVKHFGLTQLRGREQEAVEHLCKVNKWTINQAEEYINNQIDKWIDRSKHEWTVDISWTKTQIGE